MNRNEAILEGLANIGVDVCACVDLLPRDIETIEVTTQPFNVFQTVEKDRHFVVITKRQVIYLYEENKSIEQSLAAFNVTQRDVLAYLQVDYINLGEPSILVYLNYKPRLDLLVDYISRDISTQDLSTMLAVAGYMRLSLKGVYDA